MRTATRNPRKIMVAVVIVLCLTAIGVATALFGSTAPPGLTWNQPSPAPTVVAGGAATTTTISFTATGKLPNAVVQLSPSFAGLVLVSPSNLGTVYQGQTVTLTLTASAPASSTPAMVQGSIQIQKQQNPPLVVYGSPFQLSLNITWPNVASPLVTVSYPPALVAAGANIGQAVVSTGQANATYVDIPIGTSNTLPLTTFRIAVYPNPSGQSLQQWFEQNIDSGGILIQSGSYTNHIFSDGKTAFIDTAPIPASFDGTPPTGYAYILSPKGKFIASVTLSEETDLYSLGYTTDDAVFGLLQDITSNLAFNE